MQRLQAFKYELRPNGEQQRQIRRFAGSADLPQDGDTVRVVCRAPATFSSREVITDVQGCFGRDDQQLLCGIDEP